MHRHPMEVGLRFVLGQGAPSIHKGDAQTLALKIRARKAVHPEEFNIRYLGMVKMKGKEIPLKIYECFDGDASELKAKKLRTLDAFNEAVVYYFEKSFDKSLKALNWILSENPEDMTAQRMHEMVTELLYTGVPKNWTGVEEMAK